MKLRIKDNFIRLRITRGELATLRAQGSVASTMAVSSTSRLTYRIAVDAEASTMRAELKGNDLAVYIPPRMAENWERAELISLEGSQPIDATSSLRILLEKDFACLVERQGEDDGDAFGRPGGEERD